MCVQKTKKVFLEKKWKERHVVFPVARQQKEAVCDKLVGERWE
jgi:hypothetical protein